MKHSYSKLFIMGALHLPIMYAIMFVMVYSSGEIYHNINFFYMAVMMAAPMVLLMPLLMPGMYMDRKLNFLVYLSVAAALVASFLMIREQAFVGDKAFLRSMIPHHSGAILMCEKATLQDPEVKGLCDAIVKGQKDEIAQMKRILERM